MIRFQELLDRDGVKDEKSFSIGSIYSEMWCSNSSAWRWHVLVRRRVELVHSCIARTLAQLFNFLCVGAEPAQCARGS